MEIKYTLKDFNKNGIIKAYGLQKAKYLIGDNTHLFMAYTCYRRMNKYVPKDTGMLRSTVTIKEGSVTYEVPYAYAQFVGKTKGQVKKYTTAGTGKRWDLKMWNAEGHLVTKEVENYMKKLKGSK